MQNGQTEGTRELILKTAKSLLRKYGEDKMTVVDIARALEMSHANVYRFFRTKADILDAIIEEWQTRIEAFIEEIARRPSSAAERIEAVVLELHTKRRQKLLEDAEFYETYRRIVALRPDFVAKRRQKIIDIFEKLIELGIANGEFAPADPKETAMVLKDATVLFLHPLMIPTVLHEETEPRVRNVVRSVLASIAPGRE